MQMQLSSCCLNAKNFSIQTVSAHGWVKTATLKGELLNHSERQTKKKMQDFSVVCFEILNNTEDKLN